MAASGRYYKNPYQQKAEKRGEDVSLFLHSITAGCLERLGKILSTIKSQCPPAIRHRHDRGDVYAGLGGIPILLLRLYSTLKQMDNCETSELYKTSFQALSLSEEDNLQSLLKIALEYNTVALNDLERSHRQGTLLCGVVGAYAIRSILYKLWGNEEKSKKYFKKVTGRSMRDFVRRDMEYHEVLYGKSGYLCAILFLDKHLGTQFKNDDDYLQLCKDIIKDGQSDKHMHLYYEWHTKEYFGAAHGTTGILSTVLQFPVLSVSEHFDDDEDKFDSTDVEMVEKTFSFLESTRGRNGNYPSSARSARKYDPELVHWCHGAPGFVFAFLQAYRVFGDDKYLERAEEASDVVWERGLLKKGAGICHGISGNAYVFLELYRVTKNSKHLYRACCFADFAVQEAGNLRVADSPHSLFEGMAGEACLYLDLLFNTENTFFPCVNFL